MAFKGRCIGYLKVNHARMLYSLRTMGNNLLIAHCITSCHIPGHLGVANHIDLWFMTSLVLNVVASHCLSACCCVLAPPPDSTPPVASWSSLFHVAAPSGTL